MSEYDDEQLDYYASAEQVRDLNNTIIELRKEIVILKAQIEQYEKVPVPATVVEQFVQQEVQIRKLKSDLEYYMNHVPTNVIINRTNKEKPTRKGGIPKG
jgi:hypothetical protein